MLEPHHLPVRHSRAVHERCVVQFVEKDYFTTTHEPRDQTQVRLVSGREGETRLLAEECRQLVFEPLVQIKRSVQEAAARASRAIPVERDLRRCKDIWM